MEEHKLVFYLEVSCHEKTYFNGDIGSICHYDRSVGSPIKNEQPGDLKANINYGFDQKEGHGDAKSRFTGGDVTYVINDRWNLEYINNYTKGNDSHKINENYLSATIA